MHTTKKIIYFFLAVALLSLNACKTNVSRNGDGSATVETTISQEELQEVITSSIADPLVTSVTASLQSGYVLVSADRKRLNDATKTDTLSFRLDLRVSNGQLIASVSNAQLDGVAIEQNRVDNWNQTIANRLSRIGQKNNKATLESVSVTPDMVSMIWVVTK
ncbi:MAG TPA: hypothetical protein PLX14_07580 [Anaerolineales bacterium]|nr:hypothetical protein [Anaerolineales bacterium]